MTGTKYTFEADESDEEREDRMDAKQDQLLDITRRLKIGAEAFGDEINRQNIKITEIANQVCVLTRQWLFYGR